MYHIYELIDPNTKQVKYVGMTVQPKKRLYHHMYCSTNRNMRDWIRELRKEGKKPKMFIVGISNSKQDAKEMELDLIGRLGDSLLNSITDR